MHTIEATSTLDQLLKLAKVQNILAHFRGKGLELLVAWGTLAFQLVYRNQARSDSSQVSWNHAHPLFETSNFKLRSLELQLIDLKSKLTRAECELVNGEFEEHGPRASLKSLELTKEWPLQGEEYRRYGRQLIVPEIGLQG